MVNHEHGGLDPQVKQRLSARLKRVEGQVRGIMRMVDEDQYCIDVMHQVAAVQGALAEVSRQLLTRHLDTCVRAAMDADDEERRDRVLEELNEVFARYGRVDSPRKRR